MAMGRSGIAVGIIGAAGTAAFIPAFKITTIANVALIYSVAPLLAALLAWAMIRERMDARTIAGAVGAILGVGIIVSGSLGTLSVQGDALALIMTAAMATIMVIYRVYPSTPSGGPSVLQSLILLPFCVFFGEPLRTSTAEIAVLAAFGVLFAIASVTLAEGAKRFPAGQTALIGALETPLAIALGIAILSEFPGNATAIGGAVVLCAVVYSIRWRAT
ncbi:MAG: DMT family transporter [Pseudomonadota bacterium]